VFTQQDDVEFYWEVLGSNFDRASGLPSLKCIHDFLVSPPELPWPWKRPWT